MQFGTWKLWQSHRLVPLTGDGRGAARGSEGKPSGERRALTDGVAVGRSLVGAQRVPLLLASEIEGASS